MLAAGLVDHLRPVAPVLLGGGLRLPPDGVSTDLARAEAAVRGILDSPGYSPPPLPGFPPASGTCSRRGARGSPPKWALLTSANGDPRVQP
jgi:hypothetical protein